MRHLTLAAVPLVLTLTACGPNGDQGGAPQSKAPPALTETERADLLAALADGHLAATVRGDAIVGALLFEAPLKGVKSLRTVLGMTQDRPSETRFKPVAAKSRLVGVSDVESAVSAHTATCRPGSTGRVID